MLVLSGCRAPSAPVTRDVPPVPLTTSQSVASQPALADSVGRCMVRTELYFGLGRKNVPDVTEDEWRGFVDEVITPRFPDGLTIVEARGQWRGSDGVLRREPSRIVVIVHDGDSTSDASIEEIRAVFVKQFAQESVLRADAAMRVSF